MFGSFCLTMALDVKISFSWTNYCRLCLLDNGIMLPLFEEEGKSRLLGHKIETCLQLVTYDGDPLPRRICHKCLFKVNQTFEFRAMAMESYEKLKTHLLPLKHVPEVQQYLQKVDFLHARIDAGTTSSMLCSTPSKEFSSDRMKINIKKEKEPMEDENCAWPSSTSFSSVDRDSLFSSASYNSTPVTSSSNHIIESTVTSSINSSVHDTLKRKRSLDADLSTHDPVENSVPSISKKVTCKKPFVGPASRKKSSQTSQWKCMFCSNCFGNQHRLELHLQKCLKCPTCQKEFASLNEKAIHEAEEHVIVVLDFESKHMRKRCSQCPARFASSVMLATHNKYNHVESKKIKINHPVDRGLIKYEKIKNTLEDVDSDGIAGESPLGSKSESMPETDSEESYPLSVLKANNLKKSPLDTSTKCLKCFTLFSNSVSLESHVCVLTNSDSFPCTLCNESFSGANFLIDHEKEMHGRYKCPICSERFHSHKACNAHRKRHSTKQASIRKSVGKDGSLLKGALTAKKKKAFSCHTCFAEFEDEDAFILHLYKHAIEQSDDENIPKKKSRKTKSVPTSSTAVSESEEVESKVEPFSVKCERCHVVCRSKEYYTIHLATHMSKAKTSFPCTGCNQDFRNVEALNRHTCCGKQIEDRQSCCLDCGQALVQGEDHICDNKCPECDKVFKSARGQRLHFVSKHRSKVPVEDRLMVYDDPQLLGLDENQVELEVEQSDSSEKMQKKGSPLSSITGEFSYTSDSEANSNSFMGDSPSRERLPPEDSSPFRSDKDIVLPNVCKNSTLKDDVLSNICNDSASKHSVLPIVCDSSDGAIVETGKLHPSLSAS